MDILIGRDEETSCLAILVNNQKAIDSSIVVPNTVSRLKIQENTAHCKLSIEENQIILTNLNEENVTYVNGTPIYRKKIHEDSIVMLGEDQFVLRVNRLLKKIGYIKPESIKHLKRVWERYDRALLKLQIEQQKSVNQQKLQGLISQASVLCVIIPSVIPSIPIPSIIRIILVVGALLIGVYFYVRGNKTANSFLIKKRELDKEFHKNYVCPKCGYFFGFTPFENIEFKKNCPKCNVPYKS